MATPDIDRLRSLKTLPQLIAYMRDDLDWPVDQRRLKMTSPLIMRPRNSASTPLTLKPHLDAIADNCFAEANRLPRLA